MTTTQQLEQRLRTGEQMIESETDPEKRERLTEFWIRLLHDYEAAVDQEREQETEVSA